MCREKESEIRVAIMQPYFFPYIGYFQLINAVDIYVNLDHVSFMKRSYMTRNIIKNNIDINIPVHGGSQNKKCSEIMVNLSPIYINKFLKTLHHLYSKEKNYNIIMEQIIMPEFIESNISISKFNINIIKNICNYLNIKTKIIETSGNFINLHLKKQDGLKNIIKQLNSSCYINAIGGMSLYDKVDFKSDNIDLYFIKNNTDFKDQDDQNKSILHLLFKYEKAPIIEQLNKCELI